jgi:ABC-2 type transport system permease protein
MLRWRKVATIIRREYLIRVRTKAFWISTVLVPVMMLAFTVLPTLMMSRTGGSYTVAVVTGNDALYAAFERAIGERTAVEAGRGAGDAAKGEAAGPRAGDVVVRLHRVAPAPDAAAQRLMLKRQVVAKELAGILVLPETVIADGKADYVATNVSAVRLMGILERSVDAAVVYLRLTSAGVPAEKVEALTARADMRPVKIGQDLTESKEAAFEKSFVLSYILTLALYMTMMFYGYYVMRGVLEEKSSRIVEVIVANVRPMELMLGKIFGVGAVGLTQYAIWVLAAMNLAVPGMMGLASMEGSSALLSPLLLVFFVVFFVLGYFQFASFYAAIGAAFNTEEEAQQMQTVASMVMALPLVMMFPVMSNPDSTLSVVLSLVPLFAPVLFFMRMTVQMPPTWQIVLCLVLLVGSIFAIARLAAAVYRVGILMYGKRPTLREIVGWIRSS